MKLIVLNIIISIMVASCGNLIEDSSRGTGAEDTSQNSGSEGLACVKVPLPEAPSAAGQLVFTVDANVDPCSVDGYVVGYQNDLKVELATDGQLFIDNIPPGKHDIIVGTLELGVDKVFSQVLTVKSFIFLVDLT